VFDFCSFVANVKFADNFQAIRLVPPKKSLLGRQRDGENHCSPVELTGEE
jgi:hypothetical protein